MISKIPFFLIVLLAFHLSGSAQVDSATIKTGDTSIFYKTVETMPSFPGGYDSLESYLNSSPRLSLAIKSSKDQYRIYPWANVKSNGHADIGWYKFYMDMEVRETLAEMFKKMPAWNPGVHNGQFVNVDFMLPPIEIDYKRGIIIDTSITNIDSLKEADFMKLRADMMKLFQIHEHGVFFDKAIEEFKNENYSAAIKKFNNAMVADETDPVILEGRGLAYIKSDKTKFGCDDMKFSAYLSEFADSGLIVNSMSYCVADYFFNRDPFLSQGYLLPPMMHEDNETPITPPSFPGGLDSLYKFLGRNFKVEKNVNYTTFNSRVLVRFTVKKDGTIKNPKVLNCRDRILNPEAYRLVSLMPKWIPATSNNTAVDADYIFPIINFKTRRKEYFIQQNSFFDKGVELLNSSNYNDAAIQFSEAIKNDTTDLDSRYNRGVCFWKMQDKTKACYDWSIAAFYLDKNATKLVDRFCDSLIIFDGDTITTSFFANNADDSVISESVPFFPGGFEEWKKFISANVKSEKLYKEYEKTIVIKAFVSRTGRIMFPRVLSSHSAMIKTEALRLISLMPNLVPAMKNDRAREMKVVFAMRFKYD